MQLANIYSEFYSEHMKVFITRHGKTNYNENHQVCGLLEAELTQEGLEQAQALAEELVRNKEKNQIKYIYASTLQRAIKTASFAAEALGLEIQTDERLCEVHFGKQEGVPWEDPTFRRIKSNPFLRFEEGGESVLDVAHRGYSFLDDLKKKNLDGNVLIVCHGSFARILSTYFVEYSNEEYNEIRWQNCELRSYEL